MNNKPIIINSIDDFHKYFGNLDNSFVLKMRKIKLERLKSKIEQVKFEKEKFVENQRYKNAYIQMIKQQKLQSELNIITNTKKYEN
jgi:hypothetical protein